MDDQVAILDWVTRSYLSEKMTFERGPKWQGGAGREKIISEHPRWREQMIQRSSTCNKFEEEKRGLGGWYLVANKVVVEDEVGQADRASIF